jgi:hypothetical protein
MLAALFTFAVVAGGVAASRALWRALEGGADPPGPFESAASAGLAALAVVTALNWGLALAHVFTRGALLASAALLAVAFVPSALRAFRRGLARARGPRVVALAIVPLLLWGAYAFVRGALLYPYVSDALAYHLPKALLVMTTRGYAAFDGPDPRLTTFPANYELLCADVLAIERSDRLVVLAAIAAYALLGLVAAAMAERWWKGRGVHSMLSAVLLLGTPAVIVSTGAPKNDLLLSALVLAAAHFGARWAATGGRAALAFAIAATSLAVGTKPTAALLVFALAPLVAWRWRSGRRDVPWREVAAWIAGGAVVSVLLGGAAYLVNLATLRRPLGYPEGNGYGDWSHLVTFPVLALLRGFSTDDTVWVPWQGKRWFWPHDDLFFSTFGLAASLCTLALPLAFARRPRDSRAAERGLATVAVLAAFLGILPAHVQEPPVGLYLGFVRYTSFVPVVAFLWTVVPWARRASPRVAGAALVIASALFVSNAVRDVLRDQYAPWDFVAAVLTGREPPRAIHTWARRAGPWVDDYAGPDDVVAFDGAFDAWVYPLYGRSMRRKVVYLHDTASGHAVIPDDARWVAIDRSWNVVVGDPGWTDFGTYREHTLRGRPLPEDLALYEQLLRDPRFRLAYREEHANQAVFERVVPAPGRLEARAQRFKWGRIAGEPLGNRNRVT